MSRPVYEVDPNDPRAPSREVWGRLTPAERRRVLDTLPSEFPRTQPPEGDEHQLPKERSKLTLREFFRRRGRSVYLGSELPVYYPDEPMFAPDLIAILDVEEGPRDHWTVSHEGKGLDFVLEIHVSGDRQKDYERNVSRYARLGIPEYFLFDPPLGRLYGFRLPAGETTYEPIVPQAGYWRSIALELDLSLDGGRLQFTQIGGGVLLDPSEWIDRLRTMVDDALHRVEEAGRRAEQQAQRARKLADKLRELGIDPDELLSDDT